MNFEDFYNHLSGYNPGSIVFIALGNENRADDASAYHFIDKLKKQHPFAAAHYISAGRNPENVLQQILDRHPKAVILIDAAEFAAQPGEIAFLPTHHMENSLSTHGYSLALIKKYLQSTIPVDVYYLGIQPQTLEFHHPLSAAVRQGIKRFFASSTASS